MAQAAARELVESYFRNRLTDQQAYPFLRSALPDAIILVIGSYSFSMARPGSDLDIEVIVPDEAHAVMLQQAGGPRGLWVHDEEHEPLVDVKVRPLSWLKRRLEGDNPEALWTYQRALVIQDHDGHFPPMLARAEELFRGHLPLFLAERYRQLRSAVTTGDSREELAAHIMRAKAVESALILPLLARQEPYPYPKWQSWWLAKTMDRGGEVVSLCHQLLAGGEEADLAFRGLRRIIEHLLIEAGYGESLVRDFWRKL